MIYIVHFCFGTEFFDSMMGVLCKYLRESNIYEIDATLINVDNFDLDRQIYHINSFRIENFPKSKTLVKHAYLETIRENILIDKDRLTHTEYEWSEKLIKKYGPDDLTIFISDYMQYKDALNPIMFERVLMLKRKIMDLRKEYLLLVNYRGQALWDLLRNIARELREIEDRKKENEYIEVGLF